MRGRIYAAALAVLLAAPAAAPSEGELLERGRRIVAARCFLCHGMRGESASELYPQIARQHPRYLEKQLRDFREGRRKGGGMEQMAADLTDADIAALALYFSRQAPEPHPPSDPARVAVGRALYFERPGEELRSCAQCHGPDAAGSETRPRLAGQLPAYTARQLRNFRERVRRNEDELMHRVAARLSDDQIDALADFLGTLK